MEDDWKRERKKELHPIFMNATADHPSSSTKPDSALSKKSLPSLANTGMILAHPPRAIVQV